MNKHILSIIVCIIATISITAQTTMAPMSVKYRRSSLYTMISVDPTSPYVEEIKSYFVNSPIPDKYNDHNLENRIFTINVPDGKEMETMARMMIANTPPGTEIDIKNINDPQLDDIAKNLVAKWFNRSPKGGFNMDLISF